jgi:hypothetical protein
MNSHVTKHKERQAMATSNRTATVAIIAGSLIAGIASIEAAWSQATIVSEQAIGASSNNAGISTNSRITGFRMSTSEGKPTVTITIMPGDIQVTLPVDKNTERLIRGIESGQKQLPAWLLKIIDAKFAKERARLNAANAAATGNRPDKPINNTNTHTDTAMPFRENAPGLTTGMQKGR